MTMTACAVCDTRSDRGVLTHVGCFNCGSGPWAAAPDPVAEGRAEHESCQRGTPGCSVDHLSDSECLPW